MRQGVGTGAVLRGAAALALAVAFARPPAALAADDELRGPLFSDPAVVFPMPESWEREPIRHEAWAGRADLAVTLEQDAYRLLLPAIRAFEKERGVTIAVQEGTCGISAGALARRAVDIGGFCCPPGGEDRLPGLRFHTLGIVALAILVNPANPVDDLSLAQVRDIFREKVRRWSEVRTASGRQGPDWRIRPVARLHCTRRPGHWRLLLENEDLFGLGVSEVRTIAAMVVQVAENDAAIGHEVLGMAEYYGDRGAVRPLAIDGRAPTDVAALVAGEYPLFRTYTLTTWANAPARSQLADDLVAHLLRAAEAIAPRYGFAAAGRLRAAGWEFLGDELIGERR